MSEKKADGVAPGAPQGARRATGGAPGAAAEPAAKRWSAIRKKEAVLRLLRGEPVEALSRELGVEIYRLEAWREKALAGMDAGLKERHNDPLEDKLNEATRRIGELAMENAILRREREVRRPLARKRSSR
jgi:transposase